MVPERFRNSWFWIFNNYIEQYYIYYIFLSMHYLFRNLPGTIIWQDEDFHFIKHGIFSMFLSILCSLKYLDRCLSLSIHVRICYLQNNSNIFNLSYIFTFLKKYLVPDCRKPITINKPNFSKYKIKVKLSFEISNVLLQKMFHYFYFHK